MRLSNLTWGHTRKSNLWFRSSEASPANASDMDVTVEISADDMSPAEYETPATANTGWSKLHRSTDA